MNHLASRFKLVQMNNFQPFQQEKYSSTGTKHFHFHTSELVESSLVLVDSQSGFILSGALHSSHKVQNPPKWVRIAVQNIFCGRSERVVCQNGKGPAKEATSTDRNTLLLIINHIHKYPSSTAHFHDESKPQEAAPTTESTQFLLDQFSVEEGEPTSSDVKYRHFTDIWHPDINKLQFSGTDIHQYQ